MAECRPAIHPTNSLAWSSMRFLTFGRVVFFLFVLAIAWNFGGDLLALVSALAPFAGRFLLFLVPKNIAGRGAEFYGEFIIGIILFAICFKLAGLSFAFIRPETQRAGTTRQVRRIQGVLAEFTVFGLFFALFLGLLVLTP